MKKRIEQIPAEFLGGISLTAACFVVPFALAVLLALWGWAGLAFHFAASAWGF